MCRPESLVPAAERYRWRMLMWRAEDRRMDSSDAFVARIALINRGYELETAAERARSGITPFRSAVADKQMAKRITGRWV